ncbi:MAG: mechanosensitive ion channel [Alphaproteobacteria bacterium]|nr:mechanosensitive ion channel [Alphaproteobacteria bacterium]
MKKIIFLFALLMLFSFEAQAQTAMLNYTKVSGELSRLEVALKSGKVTSEETVEYIKNLNEMRGKISEDRKVTESNLSFVQKRIEALGEVPTDGSKEAYSITQKRKIFNDEATSLKSKIIEADVVTAKIDELDNIVLTIRNQELLENILDKQGPLIYPTNFLNATVAFVGFAYDVVHSPIDWLQNNQGREVVKKNMQEFLMLMVLSLTLAIFVSLIIKKKLGYQSGIEKPDYSAKLMASLWTFVSYGVIPSSLIGGFILLMKDLGLIDKSLFTISLYYFMFYLLLISLSQSVVRVLFAPENAKWRLLEVGNEKAKALCRAMLLSIILIASVSFFKSIAEETAYPKQVVDYLIMLSSAVKAFSIILVIHRFTYDYNIVKNDEEDSETTPVFKAVMLLSIFALGVFSISLFGYIKLSEFIFNRLILSVLTILSFYIVTRTVRVMVKKFLFLRFWNKNFRLSRKLMSKLNFWFSLLFTPIMVFIGSMVILALWGVSVDLLLQNIKRFLIEFSVGGVKVSIVSIAFGIFVFFVSLYIFKILKKYILINVLTKTEVDDGIKNSLSSGFGFVGFVASALFAISVMGGSLGNIALIAGALSFGVGLGFQNIVSNLVSGIIILFERPFRIGDWVVINGQEGIVKQINIRATEIETFDKSSVIIPNGTILSSSLTNRTYHNRMSRIDVAVGVAYGSDVKQVRDLLLDIVISQKYVMTEPAPFVIFENLGASSLDFTVKCYTFDVSNKGEIANNIREQILERFEAAGIDIPFPQMVVHSQK